MERGKKSVSEMVPPLTNVFNLNVYFFEIFISYHIIVLF